MITPHLSASKPGLQARMYKSQLCKKFIAVINGVLDHITGNLKTFSEKTNLIIFNQTHINLPPVLNLLICVLCALVII